jgi:outer membrane protein assembly factor BamB
MSTEVPQSDQADRLRGRILPLWWWVLAGLAAVGVLLTRFVDRGASHVFLAIAGVVLAAVAGLRYVRRGPGQFRYRLLAVGLLVGILVVLLSSLRVDDVTGNLVPTRVSFRWQPKRDETLRMPAIAAETVPPPFIAMEGTADDFPQFLGPDRNGAVDHLLLATDWASESPELMWKKERFGAGWSAFATVAGMAITMEQRGASELVTCYRIDTGEAVWAHAIEVRHETVPGGVGPRSTPTLHEGRVYAQGATGILRCLEAPTGEELWRFDVLEVAGVTPEQDYQLVQWGRAASPLIDRDRVLVAIGGPAGPQLAALDPETGELLWKQGQRQVSYASPAIGMIGDSRQILMVCEDWVSGHDAETGEVLWEYPWPGKSNANASCSQPVPVGNGRVFLSKGYAHGSALLELTRQPSGPWQVEEVWRSRNMKTKFSNVIVHDGYVYGLDDTILSCIDLDSGQRQWKRGRYGHGQLLRVSDVLLVQAESGEVVLVELNPEELVELSRFPALEGKTWNNPCLHGRYLLVRNGEQAACYRLPLRDSS